MDQALAHLNAAAALAPEDLSVHKGRLYLLLIAGRYDDMAKALGESVKALKNSDTLAEWLAYPASFFTSLMQASPGPVPDSGTGISRFPRVVANIGSVLTMLERDDEALPISSGPWTWPPKIR